MLGQRKPSLTGGEWTKKEGYPLLYSIALLQNLLSEDPSPWRPHGLAWGMNFVFPPNTHIVQKGSFEFTEHPFKSQALQAWAFAGTWNLNSKLEQCFLARISHWGWPRKGALFLQLEPGQTLGTAS